MSMAGWQGGRSEDRAPRWAADPHRENTEQTQRLDPSPGSLTGQGLL